MPTIGAAFYSDDQSPRFSRPIGKTKKSTPFFEIQRPCYTERHNYSQPRRLIHVCSGPFRGSLAENTWRARADPAELRSTRRATPRRQNRRGACSQLYRKHLSERYPCAVQSNGTGQLNPEGRHWASVGDSLRIGRQPNNVSRSPNHECGSHTLKGDWGYPRGDSSLCRVDRRRQRNQTCPMNRRGFRLRGRSSVTTKVANQSYYRYV